MSFSEAKVGQVFWQPPYKRFGFPKQRIPHCDTNTLWLLFIAPWFLGTGRTYTNMKLMLCYILWVTKFVSDPGISCFVPVSTKLRQAKLLAESGIKSQTLHSFWQKIVSVLLVYKKWWNMEWIWIETRLVSPEICALNQYVTLFKDNGRKIILT